MAKKIFIIESERLIRFDLQIQLELSGYSVFQSPSLIGAETIFRKYTPDLIIADASIQRHNNFFRMKKYFHKQQLSIVYIKTDMYTLEEYEGINIIGTFSKPFDSKELLSLIESHFNNRVP